MVGAVATRYLVHYTSILPVNGLLLMSYPIWYIFPRATSKATQAPIWLVHLWFILRYFLYELPFYVWSQIENFTCTHVWSRPLYHCMHVSLSDIPTTRHHVYKSGQYIDRRGVGFHPLKIGLNTTINYSKNHGWVPSHITIGWMELRIHMYHHHHCTPNIFTNSQYNS